jgi:hypothetical protein
MPGEAPGPFTWAILARPGSPTRGGPPQQRGDDPREDHSGHLPRSPVRGLGPAGSPPPCLNAEARALGQECTPDNVLRPEV